MLKNTQARNADIRGLATEACEPFFAHTPFRGEAEPISVCDAAHISSCLCVRFHECTSIFFSWLSALLTLLSFTLRWSSQHPVQKGVALPPQNAGIKFAPHRGITVNLGTGRGCHGRRSF